MEPRNKPVPNILVLHVMPFVTSQSFFAKIQHTLIKEALHMTHKQLVYIY